MFLSSGVPECHRPCYVCLTAWEVCPTHINDQGSNEYPHMRPANMLATCLYPLPAPVPAPTDDVDTTTTTSTNASGDEHLAAPSCAPVPTFPSLANDGDSLSPSCCPCPPLSALRTLNMLRSPSTCSTCSTCSTRSSMSSAISVASSVSDEDEATTHEDDEDDEEAAGTGQGRGQDEDEKHKFRLKVLNFNVFAGSPVPVLFKNALPKTESLEGSERLKLQVDRIRAMRPDIICLQEACSDGVERYYREALADSYDSFFEPQQPEPLGKALLAFLYLLLSALLAFCFHCLLDLWASTFTEPSSSSLFLSSWARAWTTGSSSSSSHHPDSSTQLLLALALVAKALIIVSWSMRKTCLVGFLQGQVKSSTVILWRKTRFSVVYEKHPVTHALVPAEMYTTFFQEQRGDWLNLVRPRGYLTARLLFHGMPLFIVNTHLNLGEQGYRRRQVEELTRHCQALGEEGSVVLCGDFNVTPESEEIQQLCSQAGVQDALQEKGCVEPTWSSRNPLTHGVLLEEDHRCDFIFYRGMAQRHRMVNRRCRLDVPFWGKTWLSDHFGIVLDLVLEPVVSQDGR